MHDQVEGMTGRDRDAARPPAPRRPFASRRERPEAPAARTAGSVPGDRKWRFDDAVAAARQVSAAVGRR